MTIDFQRIGPADVPEAARSYRVRMRDGIHLAADVYLPAEVEIPGPTILIRLPYDKDGEYTSIPLIAEYMTRRGYRVVAQDVRGKFRSEGQPLLFVNEVDDGYDTIEWVTCQPWSDGNVAMWGDSYYGYTQWAAVASRHPALKAIAPRVTGTGLGEFPVTPAGSRTRDVEMSIVLMYPLTHFHSQETYLWEPDWSRRPYLRDLEAFQREVGARSPSFDLWFPQPVILPRFRSGSPFDARPVPVLNTIGWWDNCAPWSWRDHAAIAQRPAWQQQEYLLIESIDHENNRFGHAEGHRDEAGIQAMLPGYLDPALEFFDVFVRGVGDASAIPRVRWNLAGTPGYRQATSWPPKDAKTLTYWANSDGVLDAVQCASECEISWVHDPDDLVPSAVDDPFSFLAEGAPDERKLAERSDVIGFATLPATVPVNLAGPATVTLTGRSTGPRTDLFLRLYDASTDGSLTRIARGQVTVEDAGTTLETTIDLGQLGYRLEFGHRLRLHVQSSDFPEFLPQPGTDESPWTATEVVSTTQTITVGGRRGLRLDVAALEDPGPAYRLLSQGDH